MPEISNGKTLIKKMTYQWLRIIERLYLSLADVIITGGDEMSAYLENEYELSGKTFVTIEQGIHHEVFTPDIRRCERAEFNVFYAGTLDQARGQVELFECMERINKMHPINLICCGKIQNSRQQPESPWLRIHSDLDYKQFVEIMTEQADLAILPYPVNDWWGKISISKLATYLAVGLPVISTDLPHTAAFLKAWDCGQTARDWNGIEKLIVKLYMNRTLCRHLGNNAVIAVSQALDWKVLQKKLETVYTSEFCQREPSS